MKLVTDIVKAVSVQLQDQRHRLEYTRWSIATLVGYLNDAANEISSIRPEAFALRRTVSLAQGFVQAVPDDCIGFVRLEANPDGTMIYEGDTELMRAHGSVPPCSVKLKFDVNGNVIFRVRSYSIDSTDPKTYYVDPPVPAGVQPQVLGTFINYPIQYSANALNAEVDVAPGVYNLMHDFMLGRAWGIDTESPEGKANSTEAYTRFYQFFNMQYKAQSNFRSGNYMGNTPAGNPASIK
jgi:hypothetical protein